MNWSMALLCFASGVAAGFVMGVMFVQAEAALAKAQLILTEIRDVQTNIVRKIEQAQELQRRHDEANKCPRFTTLLAAADWLDEHRDHIHAQAVYEHMLRRWGSPADGSVRSMMLVDAAVARQRVERLKRG